MIANQRNFLENVVDVLKDKQRETKLIAIENKQKKCSDSGVLDPWSLGAGFSFKKRK